jgi:hypothetical protein
MEAETQLWRQEQAGRTACGEGRRFFAAWAQEQSEAERWVQADGAAAGWKRARTWGEARVGAYGFVLSQVPKCEGPGAPGLGVG